jgi:hypothetical protein
MPMGYIQNIFTGLVHFAESVRQVLVFFNVPFRGFSGVPDKNIEKNLRRRVILQLAAVCDPAANRLDVFIDVF